MIKYQAKGHFPDVHAGIFCHLCGSLSAMALATGAWTHDLFAPIGIASGIHPKKRQLFALKIEKKAGLLVNSTIRPGWNITSASNAFRSTGRSGRNSTGESDTYMIIVYNINNTS
jgi:hypothetical protein